MARKSRNANTIPNIDHMTITYTNRIFCDILFT